MVERGRCALQSAKFLGMRRKTSLAATCLCTRSFSNLQYQGQQRNVTVLVNCSLLAPEIIAVRCHTHAWDVHIAGTGLW